MTRLQLIEIFAAACGVAGTLILAERPPWAGYGFVVYLASNAGWLIFAWRHRFWPLFVQTVAFALSSLWGVWRWVLQPLLGTP